MPSTIDTIEIKLKQLIPPRPQATRGKPFPLSGSEDWFIYPHGKNVYLYNLKDQSLSKEYREHAYAVGVSKLSPSGTLVASGDQCGTLRVWSLETLETKLEMRVLGGKINDLEWSEDEKYIAVCGEGRDQFANVVKVDGGASFGELTGPSKPCPSITLNSSTLLLASDDKTVTIYRASPTFKFVRTLRDHDNFVQVVKFSGDGKMFASAGADGKLLIYSNENNFNLIYQVKAHDMGILALEWIDDKFLLTASSDKSIKLWSVPEGNLVCQSEISSEWNFEKQICGIKVIGSNVLVLRLDGSIELRDKDSLKLQSDSSLAGIGHSKGIVDIKAEHDDVLNSVSYDGNLKVWKRETKNSMFSQLKEFNFQCKNVQKLIEGEKAISENKIVSKNGETLEFEEKIVFGDENVLILKNGNLISTENKKILKSFGNSIELAIFNNKNMFALYDGTLKLYNCNGSDYEMIKSFDDITSKITAMEFNPSGKVLATADDQRRIKIYTEEEAGQWQRQSSQWCHHSARIDALLFLQDDLILSSGVDGHILAWSFKTNKIGPIGTVKAAHSSPVNKLVKMGEKEFVSCASDACIKAWSIQLQGV